MPFTPRNRDNMIGWMAAQVRPGRRTASASSTSSRSRSSSSGREQVTARINQDPAISPQLTLWNQRGSRCSSATCSSIPIKDSIVYIQPLYLQAEQTAIPELTRVIVAYSDKVEMEDTLQAALLKVFGVEEPEPGATEATSVPAGGVKADAAQAAKLYTQAIDAQKRGDWAAYGRLIGELGRVLERLAAESKGATATP